MQKPIDPDGTKFWNPTFQYERRNDGTVLMWQNEPLQDYLPTVADYVEKWARLTPDQTLLAERDCSKKSIAWIKLSYAEALERSLRIGSALLDAGLRFDRPLLILSKKSIDHGLLGLACSYVGIPYAPVSPAYSLVSKDFAKLKAVVAQLSPGAVYADDGHQFENALSLIRSSIPVVINSKNSVAGAVLLETFQANDSNIALQHWKSVTSDTVVKYLFTSGSTGSPKGVINTNRMICSMQAMVRDCYRYLNDKPPVVLDWAPWNHTAAGNKMFYLAMTNGGSYYIDNGGPGPEQMEETLRNLREIACTFYFNVPAGWDSLVVALQQDEELAKQFFSQLDMMFYAGAGMSQLTWDGLRAVARKTTGREVLLATGLGSTETAPFALACTTVQEQPGNVGVPSRELIMKLVPTGRKLEVRLKGPSITPGYIGEPEKTADAFDEEGFYKMGDALRPANPDDYSQGFFFDGRIAENFKLNTGTWVAVGAVRTALVDAMGGLVQDAVITGESEAELGALLVLSEKAKSMDEANRNLQLQTAMQQAAEASTGSSNRVCRAVVLDIVPSFDRGEITEKGSLNQRGMRANYAELISAMHQGSVDVITFDG